MGSTVNTILKTAALLSLATQLYAQTATNQFNLPSQPLSESLKTVAALTNVNVLFDSDEIATRVAPALTGKATVDEALAVLLTGTGLKPRYLDEKTVVLERVRTGRAEQSSRAQSQSTDDLQLARADGAATNKAAEDAAAAQPTGNEVLPEIVVTAQKRSESIQRVPASVSFVDAGSLADLGARSLQDYAAYVPGVQVDSAGSPGQTTITLRGIAPLGSGSAVGTYIDDAPLGSSGFYAMANTFQLDLMPYDIHGVEVLRGPQGTLYGASTMGGLVKYVLLKPNSERSMAAAGVDFLSTQGADGAGLGARGMVNIPLVTGKLAVRASGFYQQAPGFIDNPVVGSDGINELHQTGGRLALGWTPNENVEITLDALRQRIDSDGNAIVPLGPTGEARPLGDLQTNIALSEPFRQQTDFLKGTLSWSLPFGTLTAVTSHNESRNRQSYDVSAISGGAFLVPQLVDIALRKNTQELRLTSDGEGRLQWMLGGFYTDERTTNDQYVGALDGDKQPLAGLDPLLTASIPSRYREQAVFGNATWRLTDRFYVGAGMRHSSNKQRYTQITGGVFAPGNGGGLSSESVNTFSGIAKFELSARTMAYARVASGYQPGGPNVALAGVPPSVGPSKLTNYEVGVKSTAFDSRLMLDIAAFRIDWKDIQVLASTPDTGTGFLVNGGEARSQGLEASLGWRPLRQMLFGLGFAYTNAEFTMDIPQLTASDGQRLPHVPRYAASATGEYRMEIAPDWVARLGAGLRYTGERPSYLFSPVVQPFVYQEHRYTALDLIARLSHGNWDLGLFARNLLDKRAYMTKTPLSGVEVFGAVLQPRTVGLSVDYGF